MLPRIMLLSFRGKQLNVKLKIKFFVFFLNGPTQASFCLFSFFSNNIIQEKVVGFSGTRTWINGEIGKHADH